MQSLTNEQLENVAPSIFAVEPWLERSAKYKFIPTINVINALRDSGYYPVKAMQSRSRIPGKAEFTKHLIRFRNNSLNEVQVNGIIPEIVLINSHDGTSAYKMMLGLFRLVCSNGLIVADATLDSIKMRHMGQGDLCQEVINVSHRIIEEAPKTLGIVKRWEAVELTKPEQVAYADGARELYDSNIDLSPDRLLSARRSEDMGNGTRSLWKTFNSVQENLIKGRILGKATNGHYRRTRAIKSVDRDVKLNRALWTLTQKMEELKTK